MGGTFDPIHIAHLALAEAAKERFNLDLVLFILSANPPHKSEAKITSAEERYNMVKLAVKDNPSFEACDIEIRRKGPSYTVLTIAELKERYKGAELYLIIGMDEAEAFTHWREYDTILKNSIVASAWRPGSHRPEDSSLPIIYFDAPAMDISSSSIREMISQGKSVRYLVADSVFDYIKEKGLYS